MIEILTKDANGKVKEESDMMYEIVIYNATADAANVMKGISGAKDLACPEKRLIWLFLITHFFTKNFRLYYGAPRCYSGYNKRKIN